MRQRNSLFQAHSHSDSMNEKTIFQTQSLSPFRQAQSFAAHFEEDVSRCVSHLFCMSCPSTVRGAVSFIAVDAIQAMLWAWAISDILSEVFERKPTSANLDSSASIVFVLTLLLIVATALHPKPLLEKPRFRGSVSYGGLRSSFSLKASTTLSMSIFQIKRCCRGLTAACASTYGSLSFETKDGQTAKSLSDDCVHDVEVNTIMNLRQ